MKWYLGNLIFQTKYDQWIQWKIYHSALIFCQIRASSLFLWSTVTKIILHYKMSYQKMTGAWSSVKRRIGIERGKLYQIIIMTRDLADASNQSWWLNSISWSRQTWWESKWLTLYNHAGSERVLNAFPFTFTSPVYANSSMACASSRRVSLRMMIGCLLGAFWKHEWLNIWFLKLSIAAKNKVVFF